MASSVWFQPTPYYCCVITIIRPVPSTLRVLPPSSALIMIWHVGALIFADYMQLLTFSLLVPPSPSFLSSFTTSLPFLPFSLLPLPSPPLQAVWVGWGHASENPKLPDLLHKHGITFIGPPAQAMWALGDKIASSIVAQTVSVPTLPWSGSGGM